MHSLECKSFVLFQYNLVYSRTGLILGLAEVQWVATKLVQLPGVCQAGAMWNMDLPSLRCNGQLHDSSNKV
jgi:hypothetical protein